MGRVSPHIPLGSQIARFLSTQPHSHKERPQPPGTTQFLGGPDVTSPRTWWGAMSLGRPRETALWEQTPGEGVGGGQVPRSKAPQAAGRRAAASIASPVCLSVCWPQGRFQGDLVTLWPPQPLLAPRFLQAQHSLRDPQGRHIPFSYRWPRFGGCAPGSGPAGRPPVAP